MYAKTYKSQIYSFDFNKKFLINRKFDVLAVIHIHRNQNHSKNRYIETCLKNEMNKFYSWFFVPLNIAKEAKRIHKNINRLVDPVKRIRMKSVFLLIHNNVQSIIGYILD